MDKERYNLKATIRKLKEEKKLLEKRLREIDKLLKNAELILRVTKGKKKVCPHTVKGNRRGYCLI